MPDAPILIFYWGDMTTGPLCECDAVSPPSLPEISKIQCMYLRNSNFPI